VTGVQTCALPIYKAGAFEALTTLPNVTLTGNRQLEALPAYMQAMDVCLMCYEVMDYTNFIYPLKLNEYLATGRPVVSAAIDAVRGLEAVVTAATGVDDWEGALSAALEPSANAPAAVAARQAQAERHDWDRLAARVADQFRKRLAEKDCR